MGHPHGPPAWVTVQLPGSRLRLGTPGFAAEGREVGMQLALQRGHALGKGEAAHPAVPWKAARSLPLSILPL